LPHFQDTGDAGLRLVKGFPQVLQGQFFSNQGCLLVAECRALRALSPEPATPA